MKSSIEKTVAQCIAVFAAIAVALCFVLGGAKLALGAAIGGAFAVGDFMFMWWAGVRIFRGPSRGRSALTVLLAMKLGIIGALLYFVIVVAGVEPLGLALGLGSLVLGIVVGALAGAPSRSLGEI